MTFLENSLDTAKMTSFENLWRNYSTSVKNRHNKHTYTLKKPINLPNESKLTEIQPCDNTGNLFKKKHILEF